MEKENNISEKVSIFDYVKDKEGKCKLHKKKSVYVENIYVTKAVDVVEVIRSAFNLKHLTEEYVWMLTLNADGRLTGIFEVSHGHLLGTVINIRGIFARALMLNASDIIVAHNHVSGRCEPSDCDAQVYQKLKSAAIIMEMSVGDSLIVSDKEYYSFNEHEKSEEQEMLERLGVPLDITGELYFDSIDEEAVQRILEINRYIAKSKALGIENKLKISIRFVNSDKMKKLLRYNKKTGVLEECSSNFYVYAELDEYKDGEEVVVPNFVNVLHIRELYSVTIYKVNIGDYVQMIDCRAKSFNGVEISKSNPYMYSLYGYPMTYTEDEIYGKIGKTRRDIIRLHQSLGE